MLAVNEIYGVVQQGEGKSAGTECMFLRLSGCNLACVWCDTPYTWNFLGSKWEHPDKYDPKLETHKMEYTDVMRELVAKANGVDTLVISGGEPMLQQRQLYPLLNLLWTDHWWVEVETNGTIEPSDLFIDYIKQFNCSPKLSNAGRDNPRSKRLNIKALTKIKNSGKGTFKFVIQSDVDLEEMREIMLLVNISPETVWLMPEGRTRREQEARQEQVKQLAKEQGYNFSPRLHILEFDSKRGV